MAKVLIAEDDVKMCGRLRDYLAFEHFTVDAVDNGNDALEKLVCNHYDVAILDWNMPGMNGLEVCRAYRSRGGNVPVLFLTARSDILEKRSGFDAGADDYLTKPFELAELGARLKALLRRPLTMISPVLTVGNVTLDSNQRCVSAGGTPIKLKPSEFALLEFLMKNSNRIFSGEELFSKVWTGEEFSGDAVRTCIKSLRKKLDFDGNGTIVKTLHGVGYKVSDED